jgi:hypothetical protein
MTDDVSRSHRIEALDPRTQEWLSCDIVTQWFDHGLNKPVSSVRFPDGRVVDVFTIGQLRTVLNEGR